jgi:DMSO/TMAO reductase YedYZ heme-binding membrane subunit
MKALLVFQKILIGISLALLISIPIFSHFIDIGFKIRGGLYKISFEAVFLVMIIRPLADIFIDWLWLRRLVLLRKGFGILSASIIIGFMLSSIIAPESVYLVSFFTAHFWSIGSYAFFAHLGDITGLILLITSNVFSQKLLKQNWKRIQRLSYVYFYAGGIYEAFALDSTFALYAMLVVTNLTVLAWAVKAWRRSVVTVTLDNAGKIA